MSTEKYRLAMRRSEREARITALRDGRKNRAATFVDRRKEAARRACRGPQEDT